MTRRRRSSCGSSCRSCSSSDCSICSRRCSFVSSSNFDGDESSSAACGVNVTASCRHPNAPRRRSANVQTDPIMSPSPSAAPVADCLEVDASALLAAANSAAPATSGNVVQSPSSSSGQQPGNKANNHQNPPPVPKRGTKKKKVDKAHHKIVINLDDKNKFTEEVTV